jgi:DNA-binding transcriptional LysR family regulator
VRFTLRQLEYFVATGDAGSVRLAAEKVNISQPSVSAAIAQLEAEFGVQLFVRHHAQGLSLTPQGERMLREARALLAHAGEISAVASELSDGVAGSLAVGFLVSVAPVLVPAVVRGFGAGHERVRLETVEDHHRGLMEGLRHGRLSAALTYDLDLPPEAAFEPLAALPPYALLPADHPLAKCRSLTLKDLAGAPYVLLDLPQSREYFLGLFLHEGLEPVVAARSPHIEVVRALVAGGQGFGLANLRPRNRAALDGAPLTYVPLHSRYRPLTLGLATLASARKPRALLAFEAWCREHIRAGQVPGTDGSES